MNLDHIKSNDDLMHYIMNFSKHGALAQVFVVEALRYYSEQITKHGEPKEDLSSFVSPVIWYKIGLEINEILEIKYGSKSSK